MWWEKKKWKYVYRKWIKLMTFLSRNLFQILKIGLELFKLWKKWYDIRIIIETYIFYFRRIILLKHIDFFTSKSFESHSQQIYLVNFFLFHFPSACNCNRIKYVNWMCAHFEQSDNGKSLNWTVYRFCLFLCHCNPNNQKIEGNLKKAKKKQKRIHQSTNTTSDV